LFTNFSAPRSAWMSVLSKVDGELCVHSAPEVVKLHDFVSQFESPVNDAADS